MNNTVPLPPPGDYAAWVAKYRADGRRERELEQSAIARRRAAGLLTVGEPRWSADNAAADEAEALLDAESGADFLEDDNCRTGLEGL